jgi:putative ABC transport system permease protein
LKIAARWIKILKDIWSYRSRSILVVLSIAVGGASVGMITNAGHIIQRDLYQDYESVNPAHLQIYASPFPEQLAKSVEGMREVQAAQAGRTEEAWIINDKDSLEEIEFYAVPDFSKIKVNQFEIESGSGIPGVREILLERQSARSLKVSVGDQVIVQTRDERQYRLRVVGIVQDVNVMPFTLLGKATGYVSMETLEWMGFSSYYNRIDLRVSGNNLEKSYVLEIGNQIKDRVVQPAGYTVGVIRIPGIGSEPGDHWAHNQINGILLILQIMGVMTVLLSCGLVINTISAILTQQVKQIGIMRSLGASRSQLTSQYLIYVLFLSLLGTLISLPIGMMGAWGLAAFAANFLNFDISSVAISWKVLLLQLILGLIVPVLVAIAPVLSSMRISVYDAIYEYGLRSTEKHGIISMLVSKIRKLSPAIALSIRNTFRKKTRLAFTLLTLTLAGAMFIAAFSTRTSLTSQIKDFTRYSIYDASRDLPGGMSRYAAEREALRVSGVTYAEGWATTSTIIVNKDGSETQDIEIVGLPYDTKTINPLLTSGIWLESNESQGVVVNEDFIEDHPEYVVHDSIVLKINGRKYTYQIVGIVSKHLSGARVYMGYRDFEKATGMQNTVNQIRVASVAGKTAKPKIQDQIAKQLDERFKNAMLPEATSSTEHEYLGTFTGVFNIILVILVIMAGTLAVVGGLGLSGAMGMNVLERTREIGVLRAVGASNFTVRQVVVIEGLIVGFISWILGAIVSAPSGWLLATAIIYAILKITPRYQYSLPGLLIWFAIVISLGAISSLIPAMRASRLRVREVLDYE